jgi:hypothetical protein
MEGPFQTFAPEPLARVKRSDDAGEPALDDVQSLHGMLIDDEVFFPNKC